MRLLYAPASPYSAKVRMAAAHFGIALQAEVTDVESLPPALLEANPLGKIPVLITDEGEAVYDSRVIMRHLDRLGGRRLFPSLAAERLEALADGICDCLLAHVYERRLRPEEKVHTPWLERQWSKTVRGLAALERDPPEMDDLDGGTIALRATLAYASLRFAGKWEADCPELINWAARFDGRYSALAGLVPA